MLAHNEFIHPQQPGKLSWVERYRPERLFYLLLVSLILSTPVNLLQSLILQGPDSLSPSQWPQLYIVRMAVAYPLAAIAIGLLAIGLAVYGFRLDQRHAQKIADKEKQTRLEETRGQFQPVHDIVQGVADSQKKQEEGIQQIQHSLAQQAVPLIPVRDIKPTTLNLGDDQSATFPYRSTIFPAVYEQAAKIFRGAIAVPQQRGLLITGAPMAGKTRLAYQTMLEYAPDWFTLTWTRGLNAAAIPAPETLTNQKLILFLDDLQQYAESERGDEFAGTSNDFPLDRLYLTLMQSAAQVVIMATCRATDLSRAETTSALRWLFEKVQVVTLPFIADDHQETVVSLLKATNAAMDYHDADFDGTIGSLLLGLSRKREQYLELKAQRHPGYLVLRAMKLLAVAGIPTHSHQRVRATVMQALGGQKTFSDELTWNTTCEDLEERQFLTATASALVIRKDVYFDKVITDYPTQVRDALLQVRQVFHSEGDSEALLALGWTHSERKEYQEMLTTSTIAVELAPSNARAHYSQGTALGYLKRNEEALAAFEQAVTLDPTLAVGWNNKGFMLDDLQRCEEALTAFDEALKLNPQYVRAWYNKGITLWKLRRYEEALLAYEEALKLNPEYADAWYNKGAYLTGRGRSEEAQAAFDKALAAVVIEPTFAPGWYNKGCMLDALDRYNAALSAYDEAIHLNPRYIEAWYNKARSLWKLERHEEALAAYGEVLAIDPRSIHAWMDKGDLLYDLKRYEDALVCYDNILAIDSQHAVAWNNKAAALSYLERNEEALACCEKALASDPQYVGAMSIQAYILNALKRYAEALALCDQALAIDVQFANLWRHKGNALRGLLRNEEALVCFEKALAIKSSYIEARYNKGAALWQLERHEEAQDAYALAILVQSWNIGGAFQDIAKAYYQEALHAFDMDSRTADDEYCKGFLLDALERYEEALVAFDAALKVKPQADYAWHCKGITLGKLKRYEEALVAFDEALNLEPQSAATWYYWYCRGVTLGKLKRYEEALAAYDEVAKLNFQGAKTFFERYVSGRYMSPAKVHDEEREEVSELVSDEFLNAEIVVLLHGANEYGQPVYSYTKMLGSALKLMFAKMRTGENFKPTDFGTVIASGLGEEPPQDLRDKMKEEYNMTDVPMPVSVPAIQPKIFDDENV